MKVEDKEAYIIGKFQDKISLSNCWFNNFSKLQCYLYTAFDIHDTSSLGILFGNSGWINIVGRK
jgi:hypothetical protein